MKKIQITKNALNELRCISSNENALFQTESGDILKILSPSYLSTFYLFTGQSMEDKILNAKEISNVPEIIVPKGAAYIGNNFVGYFMDCANGKSFVDYNKSLSITEQEDLYKFAEMYTAIEKPVREASDVVFPDLCTCDNIFIQSSQGGYDVQFIDYDGLQIGKYKSFCVSTALGDYSQVMRSKYINSDMSFKKELDIKSLIHLYFLTTFHMDLTKVGQFYPGTNNRVTLDDFFNCIHLDDWDIMDKVYKVMYGNSSNEYLGDDVFRIADTYRMHAYPVPNMPDRCIKVLEKKR